MGLSAVSASFDMKEKTVHINMKFLFCEIITLVFFQVKLNQPRVMTHMETEFCTGCSAREFCTGCPKLNIRKNALNFDYLS